MIKPGGIVNIGVIGAGFLGQIAHISQYLGNPKCWLFAVCEAKPKLREAVRSHYGFDRAYASHAELLADPEVHAVVSITRRPNTAPIALDVLSAGKHLITEKPMGHSLEQGKRLVAVAEKNQLIYSVGYMRRHDEGIQAAKTTLDRILKSGELGKLNYVRVHCYGGDAYCGINKPEVVTDEPYPQALPEWPLAPEWLPTDRTASYASFVNVFSHHINLLQYLFEREPTVEYVNLGNPAAGMIVLDYGSFRTVIEAGQAPAHLKWDDTLEVFFERGKVSVEIGAAFQKTAAIVKITNYFDQKNPIEILLNGSAQSWAFRRQADAFIDDVLLLKEPLASGKRSLSDLKLIEDIWKKEISRS